MSAAIDEHTNCSKSGGFWLYLFFCFCEIKVIWFVNVAVLSRVILDLLDLLDQRYFSYVSTLQFFFFDFAFDSELFFLLT